MSPVAVIGSGPLPDMTVVELSIVVALLDDGLAAPERVAAALGRWFARPVEARDLETSVRRMTGKGWVERQEDGSVAPTWAAQAPTQLLYAGMIRMVGAVEGRNLGREL